METPLAIVRFVHYVCVLLAFGVGLYLTAFAPTPLRADMSPPLRKAAILGALLALMSALAWFMLEGASMADDIGAAVDPSTLGDVLTSTAFGAVWQGRLPLLLALVAALVFTRADRWGLATVVAGFALASLALVDHGAMQSGGVGLAHRANDALHLLTAGYWLGGLPPFVLGLAPRRREVLGEPVATAMHRYSALGHLAVFALLVTGAANILLTSGHWPWPPTTSYRELLLAKIAVVLVMIGLAIVNRYALLPRLESRGEGARALQISALFELALAACAVALVSLFGLLDPL